MERQEFNEIEDILQKILVEPEETGYGEAKSQETQAPEAEAQAPEKVHEEKEAGKEHKGKESRTIILKVDEGSGEDAIDLVGVMSNMGKGFRMFRHLLAIAVCAGFLIAAAITGVQSVLGGGGYASAVVVFSFEGIDEGLDPNGGLFDVNQIKATPVIQSALEKLNWTDKDVDEIRANIKLEGVIPDAVKQQIAVINTVAEDAAEYYANIEDLDYFPSRYTVTLQRCRGMSGGETRELLDAILLSYKQFFMESYADTSVLGTVMSVLDVETYDYLQAADMVENEIDTMQAYVDAKEEQAPDFRANATGLSFGDLANSINTVKQLDLNNFVSFVQSNNLTKDAGTQIDYYHYQIRQYDMQIKELQSQLADVERTIAGYQKDPVIVMSNQESVTETAQKNEYYDELLEKKLELNKKIGSLTTDMNRAYSMAASLNNDALAAAEEDYAYADSLLQGLLKTVATWSGLVQDTAAEYYETDLYAGAYRISIPAQYSAAGGLGELIKMLLICGGLGALLAFAAWGVFGVREEITRMRGNETYTDNFSDMD